MRLVQRNLKEFHYKTLSSVTEDATNGVYTGDYTITYSALKSARGNIGEPSGASSREGNGISLNYGVKIILEGGTDIGIDSIVWINASTEGKPDYRVAKVYEHFGVTILHLESIDA